MVTAEYRYVSTVFNRRNMGNARELQRGLFEYLVVRTATTIFVPADRKHHISTIANLVAYIGESELPLVSIIVKNGGLLN